MQHTPADQDVCICPVSVADAVSAASGDGGFQDTR